MLIKKNKNALIIEEWKMNCFKNPIFHKTDLSFLMDKLFLFYEFFLDD